MAQIAPHYHLHDCVVPRTKLVEVLTGVYAIAKRHDLIVTNVFHAGDGNLHPLLSFDRSVPGTLERVLRASEEIVRLCVDAGGALSGEHGIGLEKRDFMPLVFTAEDLTAQACVRDAFDPAHRMNPQKVLPAGARCGDYAAARLRRTPPRPPRTCRRARGSDPSCKTRRRGGASRASGGDSVLIVGGRRTCGRGNPSRSMRALDDAARPRRELRPAEMLAVVEAGMRVGDLDGGRGTARSGRSTRRPTRPSAA